MELFFDKTNIKSFITFLHLVGLAFGVGGAWIIDTYLIRNKDTILSQDKFQIIEFISKLVVIGLILLWLSGLFFLLYYYRFTPETLENQKIWGKLFIVIALTINGYFIHSFVLPKLKGIIGSKPSASFTKREVSQLTFIGTVSFISWLFPVILGVAKTLNFTTPAIEIIAFYLVFLLVSVSLAIVISRKVIFPSSKTTRDEVEDIQVASEN